MENKRRKINWAKDPARRERQAERLRSIMKRLWADPAYRAHRIRLMHKYWDNPAWRERQSNIVKKVCAQNQVKARFHIAAMNRWKTPTTKMIHAQSNNVHKRWADPKQRNSASVRMSDPNSAARKVLVKYHADPNNRLTIRDSINNAREKRWADQEQRKMQSELMLACWANIDFRREHMKRLDDPVKKKARSERMLSLWRTDEFRQKRTKSLSQSLSKMWLDIDYKERRLKQLMGGWGRHPTEPEAAIDRLLESGYPGEFKFNGNQAGIVLAGHIPDFVNINGKKQIIELFGCYWHACRVCGYKDKKHVRHNDKRRIKDFRKLGWDCLIVWQHELRDARIIKDKIEAFVHDGQEATGKAADSVLRLIPEGFK